MNIEHLREFVYLAETLSFSITAKHFFISASVVSKHIAAIEDMLGVRLFERDRHSVSLTSAGKTFYDDIKVVLVRYDQALAHIASPLLADKLPLRVGYLRGATRPFLNVFCDFIEKHYPSVDLQVTCMEYRELPVAHRSHAVDVLLDMELDPEADLACDYEPIYTDKLYAVVGRGHPLAARGASGIATDDLKDEKLVLPDNTSYPGFADRCERIAQAAGNPEVVYRYRDIDTMFFRIDSNDCVGFTSGHNFSYFKTHAAFLPINDFETSYLVTARWLRVTNPLLIDVTRAAARECAKRMARWNDGVATGECCEDQREG